MFAISRDEKLAALQHLEVHKQKYYDAHCPKCRRANRVDGWRLEMSMPDWKKQIKSMEIEASQTPRETPKPAGAAAVSRMQAPAKATLAVKKPAPVKPTSGKPAAKKPASAGGKVKTPAKPVAAVKKPAAKKTAAKTPAASKPAKTVAKKPTAGKVKGKAVSGPRKK
jgi:hypothetical protein